MKIEYVTGDLLASDERVILHDSAMKMFHWGQVEALKNYADGSVVVIAVDVQEARERVWKTFRDHLKEHYSFNYSAEGTLDPDEADWEAEMFARLEIDLQSEPAITQVVFIRGSE